jgi:hypothetical protein
MDAAGSIGVSTTEAVEEAVVGAVHAADAVGSEAGSSVRKALKSAAALPRDVVEKAIEGTGKE